MTDIFDMAAQRTPLRIINEGLLASRSRPANHVPAEEQVLETPPSARAGAPASIREQEPPAAPEPVSSRAPRKWVRAALASLLAVLLMAGAYWYATGVHVTDDPYVNVGESGISTDVSGVVKNVDVALSSSSCVRSPRSRLSPRAIVGRPESRQGDLHLAALLSPSPRGMSADLDDNWRTLLLDVACRMLISLQQGRGY
jgi:hypothetical protein